MLNQETSPQRVTQRTVLIDHHTLYICGTDSPTPMAEEKATEDAANSQEYTGSRLGVIAMQVPMQTYVNAPVTLEEWGAEPPVDDDGWDFVVEADLPLPGDRVHMWGGGGTEPVEFEARSGVHLARISARGYMISDPRKAVGEFRVQVWPCDHGHLRLIKQWPGW